MSWSKNQHKIFRCCYITVYSSTPAPWNGACMKLLYYNAGVLQIDCVILYFHIKANSLQIDANHRITHLHLTKDLYKKIIFNVDADFSQSFCFVAVRKKTISFWTDCFWRTMYYKKYMFSFVFIKWWQQKGRCSV